MGQILHGSATTTETVRRAIQNSQASIRSLARQYGINPKTVAKWKQRSRVQDAPMGPKQAHSTVLSTEEEALIVAFRKHTLLPLDDCLYVLQATLPHLTRSTLHRCLQRHGINRLPKSHSSRWLADAFAWSAPRLLSGLQRAIALRRFGSTQDLANVVEFLTTDLSGYVTGQVISVCGGAVLHPS